VIFVILEYSINTFVASELFNTVYKRNDINASNLNINNPIILCITYFSYEFVTFFSPFAIRLAATCVVKKVLLKRGGKGRQIINFNLHSLSLSSFPFIKVSFVKAR